MNKHGTAKVNCWFYKVSMMKLLFGILFECAIHNLVLKKLFALTNLKKFIILIKRVFYRNKEIMNLPLNG